MEPTSRSQLPYAADVGLPNNARFQLDLAEIINKHRGDLSEYDDIISLIKNYSNNRSLNFSSDNLVNRKRFVRNLEETMSCTTMKPKHVDVELTNGTMATVSVFDIEAMILSLLHDENLMSPENLAPGYDLHTGKRTAPNTHHGEIHTGDAWEPA